MQIDRRRVLAGLIAAPAKTANFDSGRGARESPE
jgi:hypothetical protein